MADGDLYESKQDDFAGLSKWSGTGLLEGPMKYEGNSRCEEFVRTIVTLLSSAIAFVAIASTHDMCSSSDAWFAVFGAVMVGLVAFIGVSAVIDIRPGDWY